MRFLPSPAAQRGWAIYAVATSLVVFAIAPAARSQTTSWTGAVNANWSTATAPTNWTAGIPNATGSTVQFDTNSLANLATNNDLTGLLLTGINITNVPGTAGTNPVSIGGNAFTLGTGGIVLNGTTVATQDLTINLGANNLSLSASQSWGVNARTLTVNANNIALSTASATTLTIAPSAAGTIVLNANIVDGAASSALAISPTASTAATIRLLGTNTYTGGTSILARSEIIQVGSSSAFGTGPITFTNVPTNVVTQIQAFGGPQTIPNNVTANFGFNLGGLNNITFNGTITLDQGRAIAYNSAAGTTLTFNNTVTAGTAGAAAGTLTTSVISGTTAVVGIMVFNGVIRETPGVTSGLILNLSNGNGTAVSTDQMNALNMYSGGTTLNGAGSTVLIGISSNVTGSTINSGPLGTGPVTLGVPGGGSAAPRLQSVNGAQTLANPITIAGAANTGLQVQGNLDLTLSGLISGGSTTGITKIGGGTLTLTNGSNSYSGTTSVTGGKLIANNGATGSATGTGTVAVTGSGTVGSGGTLGGTGTITGAITIGSQTAGSQGGIIAPGNSPGTLNVGAMTWNPLGQYNFEHSTTNNTTGGGVNDFLNGTGILNLTIPTGTFTINLLPLSFTGSPGQTNYTLATFAGGITNAGASINDGTDVSSLFTLSGAFASAPAQFVTVTGTPGGPQSLVVTFTPVPEPTSMLLACAGAAGLASWRKRRRA
jgi:fibronectin-binding autotransporter adhesin